MTLEHIWPQSLGGEVAPSVFQTNDVCVKCNSTCGLFVDGAFLKSWFISAERGTSAHDYLDPEKPGIAPFWYMGVDTGFPVQPGDVCERWCGLAGEHIYHVHKEDEERWAAFAGGDIIRRNTDSGRVYIFLTSPTEYWSLTALGSVIRHFPKARLRCMTRIDGLPPLPIAMPKDPPNSEVERHETAWIDNRPGGMHPHRVAIQIDFSDRFLAKLSLGLGHTVLGEGVSQSPYADELRRMLWSRNPEQRENINLYGSGFWNDGALREVPNLLTWHGAWSVALTSIGTGFGMTLTTPGGRFMSMMISDDPSKWRSDVDPTLMRGALFIFVPQRKKAFGPIPLAEYIGHKLGNYRRPDLLELERMRSTLTSLPPKNTVGSPQEPSS